jgi:hypothetical protein
VAAAPESGGAAVGCASSAARASISARSSWMRRWLCPVSSWIMMSCWRIACRSSRTSPRNRITVALDERAVSAMTASVAFTRARSVTMASIAVRNAESAAMRSRRTT